MTLSKKEIGTLFLRWSQLAFLSLGVGYQEEGAEDDVTVRVILHELIAPLGCFHGELSF